MKRIILFIACLISFQFGYSQSCGSTINDITPPNQTNICTDGSNLPTFSMPASSLPDVQIVAELNGIIETISDDGTLDPALLNAGDEVCYTAFAYDLDSVQAVLNIAESLCPTLDALFPDLMPCGAIIDLQNGTNDGVPGLNGLEEILDFASSLGNQITTVEEALLTLENLNITIEPLGFGVCYVSSNSTCLPVQNCTDPGDCTDGDILLNGDFETGDFTNWIASDIYAPFFPLSVDCIGGFNTFGFTPIDPISGSCMSVNGFDGGGNPYGGGFINLHQEVTIPVSATAADFTFSWWVAYDLYGFGANLDRIFEMQVLPVGGGAPLAIPYTFTAMAGTVEYGSGWIPVTVDLSAFAGQTIWACFVETIPEDFSGPAQIAIDDVSLNIVCGNTCEEDITGSIISSDPLCDLSNINIVITAPDGTTTTVTSGADGTFTVPGGPFPCGIYTAAFEDITLLPTCYTNAGSTAPIDFEVDGDVTTNDGPDFIANPTIPTLSQWGLMILALLLMAFGAIKLSFRAIAPNYQTI